MGSGFDQRRRRFLKASAGLLGVGLSDVLRMQRSSASELITGSASHGFGKAKSCIVLFCWGGVSHYETWDPKPHAPPEIRGIFNPISTKVPGIQIGEHMPHLAQQTHRLAIVRSMHHGSSAHGKGMYWTMTGNAPEQEGTARNQPPSIDDRPSLAAKISRFMQAPKGLPPSIRLPYPLVDNGTLQAGEYGGWMGKRFDPIVVRTPNGTEWGGVSRNLGSAVLDFSAPVDRATITSRQSLLKNLEATGRQTHDYDGHQYFQELAHDMLASKEARDAFDLDREPKRIAESYGDHLCGRSVLLSRRLIDAGVPIVTVCCAAGDLNGSVGDHWDTHGDNFNRLKNRMLPPFDLAASALLTDLSESGKLDETLVVFATEFGRTPRINGGAGRDHYPGCYSIALAGGGIGGGQVYGKSDNMGAKPELNGCTPVDLHATVFHAMGISPRATIHDRLGRPFPVSDGDVLPLFV